MMAEVLSQARRCNWCGRFVAQEQRPTCRLLTVTDQPRRNVRQLLCPECAEAWTFPSRWNHDPDPDLPIEDI